MDGWTDTAPLYYYYYYYYNIASMQGMYIYIPETNPVPILELVI